MPFPIGRFWRKVVIGQNANVSKVPNSEHVLGQGLLRIARYKNSRLFANFKTVALNLPE